MEVRMNCSVYMTGEIERQKGVGFWEDFFFLIVEFFFSGVRVGGVGDIGLA